MPGPAGGAGGGGRRCSVTVTGAICSRALRASENKTAVRRAACSRPPTFCVPDPFFPLSFLVNSWVLGTLDDLFQSVFLCALLLFWLCVYHGIRVQVSLRPPLPALGAPQRWARVSSLGGREGGRHADLLRGSLRLGVCQNC